MEGFKETNAEVMSLYALPLHFMPFKLLLLPSDDRTFREIVLTQRLADGISLQSNLLLQLDVGR